MKRKLFERRQKMVKYIAQGIQLRVVMNQLAQDYNVKENTVWQDWYRRDRWLPVVLQIDEESSKKFFSDLFAMIMEARNAFWKIYQQTDNPFAQIKAIEEAVSTAEIQMKILGSLLYNSQVKISNGKKLIQIDTETKNFLSELIDIEKNEMNTIKINLLKN